MAHEIHIDTNNKASFAFTGNRQHIWHGLGQEMPEDSTIDEWKIAANMNWTAKESPILFNDGNDMPTIFKGKKALYRSDTNEQLSVVGADYNIVHPGEILEFFRDLLENNGMKLSAAGVLYNGVRFWATAELEKNYEVIPGDSHTNYLLLTTSLDGTLATTAKCVAQRSICKNTLTIALNETSKNMVRVSHATEFDANKAKIDLGLVSESQQQFLENMRKLVSTSCTDSDARKFYQDLYFNKEVAIDDQHGTVVKKVNDMMHLYKFGDGSQFAPNTLYQILQGVTDYHTHSIKSRSNDAKFWNSFYTSDKPKLLAQNKLLQMAA